MVIITKEQFIELRDREDCLKVIKWPWLHQKMLLQEFILLAKNAGVEDNDLQFIIWKFDNPWWETAFGGGESFAKIVDNYLNRKAESGMEVKELLGLFADFRDTYKTREIEMVLFPDESGEVQDWDGNRIFEFDNIEELIKEFSVHCAKTQKPDYKSLFSVVDGSLVAKFAGFEAGIVITEENALPLSWTKWVVRGEAMNETGKIILSYPSEGATCACCELYPHCINCPIALFSGTIGCHNTPYDDFLKASRNKDLFAAMKANERMEEFLKSLMEKK